MPQVALLAAVVLSLLQPSDPAPSKGPAPARTWFGTIQDLELRKYAPKHPFITSAADFAYLWKAWKPADLVPEIDFRRNLILVETHGTRKIDRFRLDLTKEGDLQVAVEFSDHKNFPGFTFGMALVSRRGIQSVGGKELAE